MAIKKINKIEARSGAKILLELLESEGVEYVFGNPEPLMQLITTERGARLFAHTAFGCDPLSDPLWSDARFRAAMHKLSIEPCPLAKPWPIGKPPPAR